MEESQKRGSDQFNHHRSLDICRDMTSTLNIPLKPFLDQDWTGRPTNQPTKTMQNQDLTNQPTDRPKQCKIRIRQTDEHTNQNNAKPMN